MSRYEKRCLGAIRLRRDGCRVPRAVLTFSLTAELERAVHVVGVRLVTRRSDERPRDGRPTCLMVEAEDMVWRWD